MAWVSEGTTCTDGGAQMHTKRDEALGLLFTSRGETPDWVAIANIVSTYSSEPSGRPLHTLHRVYSGLFRSPLCVLLSVEH